MKKRLIWFAIILLVCAAAVVVVIVPEVRNFFRNTAGFKAVYAWLRDNFYDLYAIFRYGDRRFALVSIVAIAVIAFISFGLLKVPAVDDSTVEPKAVNQKPVINKTNGKASMVVIEETEGGK